MLLSAEIKSMHSQTGVWFEKRCVACCDQLSCFVVFPLHWHFSFAALLSCGMLA